MILRGEGKDITWLKWPQTTPKSASDFLPAVLYGTGEYGLEQLSLMVRNAKMVLRDLSFDALHQALYDRREAPIPEMKSFLPRRGQARDVFLRQVRIHYLPYSGRPRREPQDDPQWQFGGQWGITNHTTVDLTVIMAGVRNVEISDCEFIGTQRFLDLQSARLVRNRFSNQMGVSWTDLGGQYVIFEGNRIIGASSWRNALLPVRYLYIAHNFSRNIERGEREALTFDVNRVFGRRGQSSVEPWQGQVASASERTLRLQEAALSGSYRGFDVQIVSGRGAGQYRAVEDNIADTVTISHPWAVAPDETSVILIHRLLGHVIFYGNRAEDTSVLGQVWGYLYDAVFDSNQVRRSQGMWGLAGWFVQWLNNQLDVAVTYHAGVGPAGPTPEKGAEYGYLGFTATGRIAALPIRFPYVRAAMMRGNRLSYGHRVLVMWGYGGERKQVDFIPARDVVIDHNQIEHTPVGIELGANVEGAVVAHNAFDDVKEPLRLHDPERVLVLKNGVKSVE